MKQKEKVWGVLEVTLTYAAMVVGFRLLGWAIVDLPQSGSITQLVVLTLGPIGWLLALRRKLGDFGITFTSVLPSLALAWRACAVVGPTCMIFWVVQLLGSNLRQWLGSSLVALAFLIIVPLVARWTSPLPTRDATADHPRSVLGLVGVLVIAMVVSLMTIRAAPVMAGLFYYCLVAGFSEEIAFRGLIQSRLNQVLGRPFQWHGIRFGPGLFIAALMFGLAHTLVARGIPWPAMLFTTAFGITLGFMREKDGSVLAPAILHGLLGIPRAFIG